MENPIKTATIIYNPVATRVNKGFLEKLIGNLASRGIEAAAVESEWAGHVVPLVKKYNPLCDLIISVGGDGTLGECFKGFHGEKQYALYAHLPLGTGNDAIKKFGLKDDPFKSLDMILSGEIMDMDIPIVNGEPFSHASAFGFLMNIPYDTSHSLKRRLGSVSYIVCAVKEFFKGSNRIHFKYTMNGDEIDDSAALIVISSTNNLVGMDIYGDVKFDDGLFEVLFLRRFTLVFLIRLLSDWRKGCLDFAHLGDEIKIFSTDDIKISFNNDKKHFDLCNDGDKFPLGNGDLTLRYKIDGKIKMLLPAESKSTKKTESGV
ncbi:MAG: hypothetical protein FWF08_05830 [Oscillospiraceae bacterium]|nr:hypothetical protein [Oscillospiraceae bacterium]